MTLSDISFLRIQNQEIQHQRFSLAKDLVAHMGAMQAQDFLMARWAVGLRLQASSDASIVEAYNKGEIIRTHLMRPTWHFVSRDDVYWMLELTAPQIKTLCKSRDRQLELDESIYSRSNAILEKALGGVNLNREELTRLYLDANIRTNENRLSHLLMRAELEGIVCNGAIKQNKLTYALLSEKVPVRKLLSREESLVELAMRYFTSHAPATLRDFIWWSGLSVSDARKAVEMIKSDFISETIDGTAYLFCNDQPDISQHNSLYLLPAFDELLIGYTNRTATITSTHHPIAITNNGLFRPIIVENGRVTGVWKRVTVKTEVIIEVTYFSGVTESIKTVLEQEIKKQALFLGKEVELVIAKENYQLQK
jgi:hypothetical protein